MNPHIKRLALVAILASSIMETVKILHDVTTPEAPRKSFVGKLLLGQKQS